MVTPKIRLQFAKRLKQLRLKHKLTQEEMAERAGIDSRYYQRLESKRPGAAKIDTIERLAKALNTKPSKLLEF